MPIVNPDNNSLTSGIQEAIDSCIDGFVILGSGEYHIQKSLIIKSGTRLISSNKAILVPIYNEDQEMVITNLIAIYSNAKDNAPICSGI